MIGQSGQSYHGIKRKNTQRVRDGIMKINEEIIRKMFPEKMERIKNNKCYICNDIINIKDFRDHLSKKVFKISGMCQRCQDRFFEAP